MKTIQIKTILFLSVLTLLFAACKKDNSPEIDPENQLTGYWINPVISDSVWTFERAGSFEEDGYGISFKTGNAFTERKNAGWCGTPPITYANFEGSWTQTDSLIDISVAFWGGTSYYQWEILTLNESTLTVVIKSHIDQISS